MKAIYTLWEDSRNKVNAGFATPRDLAATLALSVEYARKQFSRVELYTNDAGRELLAPFNIPFSEIFTTHTVLDGVLDANLWAYAKLKTYALQREPFVHIDNDVILWDEIPQSIKNAPLWFQNKEKLADHPTYKLLLAGLHLLESPPYDILYHAPEYALNCGVVGCNYLPIIKEWHKKAEQLIFAPENTGFWRSRSDKHSHNHLFEQYFISALAKKYGLENSVKVLLPDFKYGIKHNEQFYNITHLWGESKRSESTMQLIRKRLFNDFPQYKSIFAPETAHPVIFENIYKNNVWEKGSGGGSYPENTGEYRAFLQNFLREKQIKNVVDLGCGDWQFSQLLNWDGINYLGVDCVHFLTEENRKRFAKKGSIDFETADITNFNVPPCDLLIIKDVFIHWRNEEIQNFFKRSIPAKYILVTNDNRVNGQHKDITAPGQYRDVDITKHPFNLAAKPVLVWEKLSKTTHLIEQ